MDPEFNVIRDRNDSSYIRGLIIIIIIIIMIM